MPVDVAVFSLTTVLLLPLVLLEFPDELGAGVLEEVDPGLETFKISPG